MTSRFGGDVLESGDRVGDWIVECRLGEGGMGAVYRCHSVLSDAMKAALKVMKSHTLGAGRERFAQELQSLAMLSHPGIVRVLGGGEDRERGLLFLVMELLTGESLADRIRRGPLPATEAVPLFRSIADSLAYAQAAGIHHRDVKPENIMLVAGAGPKLVDFGIAKSTGGAQLTMAGAVPGTLAYLAPEHFSSDAPDPALADVYSLGLSLHEALTGQCAYAVSTTSNADFGRLVGRKLDSKPMDPGTAFSAPLRELVRRATEPDPARRIASMAEFAAGLGALAVDPLSQPWGARPAAPVPPPQTVAVRREDRPVTVPVVAPVSGGSGGKWFAAGALGLVGGGVLVTAVVGIAVAAFFAWPSDPPEIATPEPAVEEPAAPVVAEPAEVPVAVVPPAPAPAPLPAPVQPEAPKPAQSRPAPSRPVPVAMPVPVPVAEPEPEPEPVVEPEPEPAPMAVAVRTVRIIAPSSTTGVLVRDGTGEIQQVSTNQSVDVRVGDVQVQHGFAGASVIVNVKNDSQRIVCSTPDSCVVK
jgi:hypothetical protein